MQQKTDLDAEFANMVGSTTREQCMEKLDKIVKKFGSSTMLETGVNRLIDLCQNHWNTLIQFNDDNFEKRFFRLPIMEYLVGDKDGRVEPLQCMKLMYFLSQIARISIHKSMIVVKEVCNILRAKYAFDDLKTDCCELFPMERMFILEFRTQIVIPILTNDKSSETLVCELLCKKFPHIFTGSSFAYLRYCYNVIGIVDLFSDFEAQKLFSTFLSKMQDCDCDTLLQKLQTPTLLPPADSMDIDSKDSTKIDEWKVRANVVESCFVMLSSYVDEQMKCLSVSPVIKQEDHHAQILSEQCKQAERMLEVMTSSFFDIGLNNSFHHFQWILFQAASQSSQYTEAFVQNLWTIAISWDEQLHERFAAFSLLKSFFIVSNFLPVQFVHDFLKNVLEFLNNFLDENGPDQTGAAPTVFSNDDIMFVTMTVGFIEIFCMVHSTFESIQLQILKGYNLKRILLENHFHPIAYLSSEMRETFQKLVIYYRIGYQSFSGFKVRDLQSMNENLNPNAPKFGGIVFDSIRERFKHLVRISHFSRQYVHY